MSTKSAESFSSDEKVKKRKDFEYLFKVGKRIQGKNITLISTKLSNQEETIERRVGIVISRRIKGSIIRNKLKRRLRDIYRRHKENFKGEYIILAYSGAESMSFMELKKETLKLTNSFIRN